MPAGTLLAASPDSTDLNTLSNSAFGMQALRLYQPVLPQDLMTASKFINVWLVALEPPIMPCGGWLA